MKKLEPTPQKYLGQYDMDELDYIKKDYKPYTVISLFSGCGGFDIGTAQAGFQTRVMVEWDKSACATLRANFTKAGHVEMVNKMIADEMKELKPRKKTIRSLEEWKKRGPTRVEDSKLGWYHEPEPAILCEDITKLSTETILKAGNLRVGECTLLTGGFPCQGFSTARGGARDITNYAYDERNFLYLECVRVIREALPKTFCLENVPGLVQMEKGKIIRMICNDLSVSGYNITWYKLNAADYGVPQNRIRIFIYGSRNDVLSVGKNGRPAYIMGGMHGPIKHPQWFLDKYPEETQKSLFEELKK